MGLINTNEKRFISLLGHGAARFILIFYAIIVICPMLWTVSASLKSNKEFFTNIYGLPEVFQFANYIKAWNEAGVGHYFGNSAVITVLACFLIVVMATTTSYCLARYSFKLNKLIFLSYISGLLIPTMAGILPLFLLLGKLSMLDNRLALVLIYSVYSMPFSVFLLITFFKSISKEIEEAALMDGCSHNKLFFRVMLPLAMPGIIPMLIINFLNVWNEFTFNYVFISSDEKRSLQAGLVKLFATQYQHMDWAVLFAGLVIVMLPTIIVFLLFQRKIVENITMGSLKG